MGTEQSDKILGAHGSDKLIGLGGVDVIFGDEMPNNPASRRTSSTVAPATTSSTRATARASIGGHGNDNIHARDGGGTIDCGPGKDMVGQSKKRRKNWKIAKDCETITYNLEKKYGLSVPGSPSAVPALSCADPATVAQLVEHFTRNEGVSGSNPLGGFRKCL